MPSSSPPDSLNRLPVGWVAPGVMDIDFGDLDRDTRLRRDERVLIGEWMGKQVQRGQIREAVPHAYAPLARIWDRFPQTTQAAERSWKEVLFHVHHRNRTVWAFDEQDWSDLVLDKTCRVARGRRFIFTAAYLIGGYRYSPRLRAMVPSTMAAELVFGHETYWNLLLKIENTLEGLGYVGAERRNFLSAALSTLVLTARSADPRDFSEELLWKLSESQHGQTVTNSCGKISRALAMLGHISGPLRMRKYPTYEDRDTTGIAPEWVSMVNRWRRTSTIGQATRASAHGVLLKFGLWLARTHPEVRTPEDWNAGIAAEAIALVAEMRVGDYTLPDSDRISPDRIGKPLMVNSRSAVIMHLRRFFFDIEAWEWVTLKFNPRLHLATPSRILKQSGTNPRVIDDRIWLKIVWAALNLKPEDAAESPFWPFKLLHAVSIVWTHAGLRMNEICRLRLGCTIMQTDEIVDENGVTPPGSVCYLTVPPSKTAREFTKPVAPIVHEAIECWAAVRPNQPKVVDGKTGEAVPFLFSNKGRQISNYFFDQTMIPTLCSKAGVPREDSRGKITSHRARSSAMTALANSKEGLSLPELMKWAGHACSRSTLHYLAIRPTRLAATFAKADRMSHMVDVLIDHDAIVDGDAAKGGPYKFYDLGDSYCTNPFWSTCPHRMACARCDFNLPKDSSMAQALEARSSVQRLLEEVPLTDDERTMAKGDQGAIETFVSKLERKPTLDGRTRRQIVDVDVGVGLGSGEVTAERPPGPEGSG